VRTIIAGSRTITSYLHVAEAMATAALFDIQPTVIFSGAAAGVDTLGERWAEQRKILVHRFPARWRNANGVYNPRAGFERNETMVLYADALVAVWDGHSGGTRHVIEFATRQKLRVWVHQISVTTDK
jgi:hypothetical protein